jgi:hypothetical protein
VDPRVTLPPSLKRTKTRFAASSKGHRAASLDEDPKGWRGVGVDRRRHGRTDCRDALPVAQGRVDETNLSHRFSYSPKTVVVKLIVSRLTYAETRISRLSDPIEQEPEKLQLSWPLCKLEVSLL